MTNPLALILVIGLSLPTLVQARTADVSCDDSTRMTERLKHVWGAERMGMGMRDPDKMVEVWVTERNGDWLIIQNYANGTSCIVAMGEHWHPGQPGPA
ncbi:hypothetical protein [Roseobacter sinensis]|uniref:Uncharacterized protein n=1 Tax=Roseobacter sinensis TaxID=2931391 RepID=A0ABT3BK60_9RHOB|nr:hypothetical protein [Roseobacter sp. WL0113]MCV3273608.1 hypothetical protein [Roseobacter sp. WL0113]